MKHLFFTGILAAIFVKHVNAQQYTCTADLVNVENDRVKVSCAVPKQTKEKVDFVFASLIPGSYAYKDYGRYIEDFRAYDESGKALKVSQADKYNYTIEDAGRLAKVEYFVNDSWEEKNGKKFIFQPGGTNIESGKNFVINNCGFFGYVEGMQSIPYNITFHKPARFRGYTYLSRQSRDSVTDVISAPSFDMLVDNPILYCMPDDTSFTIGNTTIEVCVYSERGLVESPVMASIVKPIAGALEKFFGTLPVDRYVFMFYLANADRVPQRRGKGMGSGFGALEHNHCSFYFMPEVSGFEANKNMFGDVISHELLHILTPLNLHSREIESFNFRKPDMSQHLWLYEGVTEYFSHLVLLQDTLQTTDGFMREMRRAMVRSEKFDRFSMTDMSKNVVEKANQKRYLSVYSRGALLAMMLDILIIDVTGGNSSLRETLMKLLEKYGPSKPFNDEDLIGEIVALTHPDVGIFFRRHIIGEEMPDFAEYFRRIGYTYDADYEKNIYYFGQFGIGYDDEKNEFAFINVQENLLGVREGDVLLSINDQVMDTDNMELLYEEYFSDNETGKEAKVEVLRNGSKKILEAKPQRGIKRSAHYIAPMKNPEQKHIDNFRKFSGKEFPGTNSD